jgi:hypothetical protein
MGRGLAVSPLSPERYGNRYEKKGWIELQPLRVR